VDKDRSLTTRQSQELSKTSKSATLIDKHISLAKLENSTNRDSWFYDTLFKEFYGERHSEVLELVEIEDRGIYCLSCRKIITHTDGKSTLPEVREALNRHFSDIHEISMTFAYNHEGKEDQRK